MEKAYSEVSIPAAQHLPPSSLAQTSTQAPKVALGAGSPRPRPRTDRSIVTINIVLCVGHLMIGRGLIAFYVPEEEDNNDKNISEFLRNPLSENRHDSLYFSELL